MKTYCGADCDVCTMKENCKGCVATDGHPFGGDCVLAKCCAKKEDVINSLSEYKRRLLKEINALGIKGLPEVEELYALNGSFINLEYTLPNKTKVKLLKDENVYFGTQIQKSAAECFGIAADDDIILVSSYGENGINPQIELYKKRE